MRLSQWSVAAFLEAGWTEHAYRIKRKIHEQLSDCHRQVDKTRLANGTIRSNFFYVVCNRWNPCRWKLANHATIPIAQTLNHKFSIHTCCGMHHADMKAWNSRNSAHCGCAPKYWFKHDARGRCQLGFEHRHRISFHHWGKNLLQLIEEWHSNFSCAMLVKNGVVSCTFFASPIALSLRQDVGITVERCWTDIKNKTLQLWHWTVSDETRTAAPRWTHWHFPPKTQSSSNAQFVSTLVHLFFFLAPFSEMFWFLSTSGYVYFNQSWLRIGTIVAMCLLWISTIVFHRSGVDIYKFTNISEFPRLPPAFATNVQKGGDKITVCWFYQSLVCNHVLHAVRQFCLWAFQNEKKRFDLWSESICCSPQHLRHWFQGVRDQYSRQQ